MCRRLDMASDPPSVCRGCANRLSTSNEGVDIFNDTSSDSRKDNSNVKAGIELITGLTISDSDSLPRRLCVECNNKLKEFLAFRTQLLNSLRVFLSSGSGESCNEPGNNSDDISIPELNQGVKIELLNSYQDNKRTSIEPVGCIRELNSKIDEDVESDIDVCSGEDYDVLELDVQNKKDEIYEIESSDESDIQICDYEPNRFL